jgi:UDP-N-acetylmuramate--alanine ligase
VVEADESDASFLNLQPVIAVVTNIDADHMETYGHDFARLKQAFVEFLSAAAFLRHGGAVHRRRQRARDPAVHVQAGVDLRLAEARRSAQSTCGRAGTHALHRAARRGRQSRSTSRSTCRGCTTCSTRWPRSRWRWKSARRRRDRPALAEFTGVGRRFAALRRGGDRRRRRLHADRRLRPPPGRDGGDARGGARRLPGRRLVLAFQPHRFTRTRDCFEDFVRVLSTADALLLAEVYPAGESPIVAADGRALARAVRVAGKVEPVFVESDRRDAGGDSGCGKPATW